MVNGWLRFLGTISGMLLLLKIVENILAFDQVKIKISQAINVDTNGRYHLHPR